MSISSLFRAWLASAAKGKLREAAVEAAQRQMGQNAANPAAPPDARPQPCDFGLVFALGIESGSMEDRLAGCVTIRGDGFVVRQGELNGRRVVLMIAGAGRKNAARAAEALIDGHRPARVISAGFAGGLDPALQRNDILLADRLLSANGSELAVELPADIVSLAQRGAVRVGALFSADYVVRSPRQKRALLEQSGALAVDMETFAVVEVCRERGVPFIAVRVVNDPADETLPNDVENLLRQKSGPARLGAAVGALWCRPGSAIDMYQLRENALVASDRLAKFLAGIIR